MMHLLPTTDPTTDHRPPNRVWSTDTGWLIEEDRPYNQDGWDPDLLYHVRTVRSFDLDYDWLTHPDYDYGERWLTMSEAIDYTNHHRPPGA